MKFATTKEAQWSPQSPQSPQIPCRILEFTSDCGAARAGRVLAPYGVVCIMYLSMQIYYINMYLFSSTYSTYVHHRLIVIVPAHCLCTSQSNLQDDFLFWAEEFVSNAGIQPRRRECCMHPPHDVVRTATRGICSPCVRLHVCMFPCFHVSMQPWLCRRYYDMHCG